MGETIYFYRYVDEDGGGAEIVRVFCVEMPLIEENAISYLVENKYNIDTEGVKKWISKVSKEKWAYSTREQALESFIKRKQKQIVILKERIDNEATALSIAKEMQENN